MVPTGSWAAHTTDVAMHSTQLTTKRVTTRSEWLYGFLVNESGVPSNQIAYHACSGDRAVMRFERLPLLRRLALDAPILDQHATERRTLRVLAV